MEGCPERAKYTGRLREDFMYRYWKSKVVIMQERSGPLAQCDQCGMHIPAARIFKHRYTEKCSRVTERRLRRIDVEMAAMCG